MEGIFTRVINGRTLRHTHIGIHKVETYWTYTRNAHTNGEDTGGGLHSEKTQAERHTGKCIVTCGLHADE